MFAVPSRIHRHHATETIKATFLRSFGSLSKYKRTLRPKRTIINPTTKRFIMPFMKNVVIFGEFVSHPAKLVGNGAALVVTLAIPR